MSIIKYIRNIIVVPISITDDLIMLTMCVCVMMAYMPEMVTLQIVEAVADNTSVPTSVAVLLINVFILLKIISFYYG